MSKSGGVDSVRENPSLDGEAEYTMRTAPMQGTQSCPPRPEPTVEFINDRHSGGGMGMSKFGGAKTSGTVTVGQSGAGVAPREAAERSQGGKRTREANQKDTRRGRKGARGATAEYLAEQAPRLINSGRAVYEDAMGVGNTARGMMGVGYKLAGEGRKKRR